LIDGVGFRIWRHSLKRWPWRHFAVKSLMLCRHIAREFWGQRIHWDGWLCYYACHIMIAVKMVIFWGGVGRLPPGPHAYVPVYVSWYPCACYNKFECMYSSSDRM